MTRPVSPAPSGGPPRAPAPKRNVYEPDHKSHFKINLAIGLVAIVVIVSVARFVVTRENPSAVPSVPTASIPFSTSATTTPSATALPTIEVYGGGGAVEQINNAVTGAADIDLEPLGIGVSPDGGGIDGAVIIGDRKRHGLVKIANGKSVLLVGQTGSTLDALQGLGATLQSPDHLAVDNAGHVYFSDQDRLLYKMDLNAVVTRVGGDPLLAASTTGSNRTTPVTRIGGVGLDRSGRLHVATESGVYRMDGDALVLVGGGGAARGEGIPALGAELKGLTALSVGVDGSLLVVDGAQKVRRIDPAGVLTTLPDLPGGPHVLADLAVDRKGDVFVLDRISRQIWRIRTGETPVPVAGTGQKGFPYGAGPPLKADLNALERITVDDRGTIFVSDGGAGRVYRITGLAG